MEERQKTSKFNGKRKELIAKIEEGQQRNRVDDLQSEHIDLEIITGKIHSFILYTSFVTTVSVNASVMKLYFYYIIYKHD